ncbi:MAG: prohibitin family protein [bacterium]
MKYFFAIVILIAIALAVWGCAEIGPQEAGVRTVMIGFERGVGKTNWLKRGTSPKALSPGLYINIPHIVNIDKYPVNELSYDMFKENGEGRNDISFKTKDGQTAWIDVTIRYRLEAEKVPILHREYGHLYLENVLLPTVRSYLSNELGRYLAEDIFDGGIRRNISTEVVKLINNGEDGRRGTREIGLEVVDVLLRQFEFTAEYQAAVDQKKIASDQYLAALDLAKKREAEAEGEKLAAVQEAVAHAESIRLQADAELYARLKESEGIAQIGKAQAEAQAAMVEALGGGDILVKLEFAKSLSPKLQIWGIPTGQQNCSLLDLSGIFGHLLPKLEDNAPSRSGP